MEEFWKEMYRLYPKAAIQLEKFIETTLDDPSLFYSFKEVHPAMQIGMAELFIARERNRQYIEDGKRFIKHYLELIEKGEKL